MKYFRSSKLRNGGNFQDDKTPKTLAHLVGNKTGLLLMELRVKLAAQTDSRIPLVSQSVVKRTISRRVFPLSDFALQYCQLVVDRQYQRYLLHCRVCVSSALSRRNSSGRGPTTLCVTSSFCGQPGSEVGALHPLYPSSAFQRCS